MHKSQSLFYLTTALHVSGVTITHLQEHKTTVTIQHLVTVTPYCFLLLSWKSWNRFECVVGGVRHHTILISYYSKSLKRFLPFWFCYQTSVSIYRVPQMRPLSRPLYFLHSITE